MRTARWLLPAFVIGLLAAPAVFAQSFEALAIRYQQSISELLREKQSEQAQTAGKMYVGAAKRVMGEASAEHAIALMWLASAYQAGNKLEEAASTYGQAAETFERAGAQRNPAFGVAVYWLAANTLYLGRYAEAERHYRRALPIVEEAYGPQHSYVASIYGDLANVVGMLGRFEEVEPLYRRALTIREKAVGTDHPDYALLLHNLGVFYMTRGRIAEAEPLIERTLVIREKAFGADHADVAASLNALSSIRSAQKRDRDAEELAMRALKIYEALFGPEFAEVATVLDHIANMQTTRGQHSEAEQLYVRALAIRSKALGAEHPLTALSLNNLAMNYRFQGRIYEAEKHLKHMLEVTERAYGLDNRPTATAYYNVGEFYFGQREWAKAAQYWRASVAIIARRMRRETQVTGVGLSGKTESEAQQERHRFVGLIKLLYLLGAVEHRPASEFAGEAFIAAQWARASETAASVAQMAARQAKGGGPLAQLVRERQDLVAEWQVADKNLNAARAQPSDRRDPVETAKHSERMAVIDQRISEIDRVLAKDFPEYAALTNPEPLMLSEVQALLGSDEVLLSIVDTSEWMLTPEESFIWVVTKTDARWVRSDVGTKALTHHVAALRCGLDLAAWEADGASRCSALLGTSATGDVKSGSTPPFDIGRAHDLNQALFGQVQELTKDKRLLIVPAGPLAALPFHVLVTEAPAKATAYRDAAWLARRHAITVLPSVPSLKALRQLAKSSQASEPFIGFGNPLLLGPHGNDRRAWERQTCKGALSPVTRIAGRSIRSTLPSFFRSGLANIDHVRAQYPLPETADELCAVAHSMGSKEEMVHLGERASERTVKRLSTEGKLARARVIHFATHGLLAGETEMLASARAEPALILTPPVQASEEDDGLLTASEIAQLKLDADWVVLSACNTAAGESDKPSAEALSGLARAFFYAGARALLVSHWAVDSQAAVRLVTQAFHEIKSDNKVGRAEALRRSMLALINSSGRNAHPANWAPFIVVGEGAR